MYNRAFPIGNAPFLIAGGMMSLFRLPRGKLAFAQRSGAMKAPVGLLSDRTVLRSKMEGPCPDKFTFAKRSAAMKAPVGNALFVGIKVGRTTLAKVMPYMLMYYAAIILGLLLVTYIPAVSMVLPQVTGLV